MLSFFPRDELKIVAGIDSLSTNSAVCFRAFVSSYRHPDIQLDLVCHDLVTTSPSASPRQRQPRVHAEALARDVFAPVCRADHLCSAKSGSSWRCAAISLGSAPRSNMRRTRSMIRKSQRGSGKEIRTSSAWPLSASEMPRVPESPLSEMVRR